MERPDDLRRDAIALHANFIHPASRTGMAVHNHIRRHVLHDLCAAANDGHFTDPAELVNRRQPAHNRIILHHHMPGHRAVVAKNHMVADAAVVGNVGIRQKIAVRSNSRVEPVASRCVHRHVFPENIRRADLEITFATGILQVLRLQPETGKRIKFVLRPNGRQPVQDHMGMQPAAFAEFDMGANNGIGPDLAAGADLRLRVYNS